jgi:hypothetical protein
MSIHASTYSSESAGGGADEQCAQQLARAIDVAGVQRGECGPELVGVLAGAATAECQDTAGRPAMALGGPSRLERSPTALAEGRS